MTVNSLKCLGELTRQQHLCHRWLCCFSVEKKNTFLLLWLHKYELPIIAILAQTTLITF